MKRALGMHNQGHGECPYQQAVPGPGFLKMLKS